MVVILALALALAPAHLHGWHEQSTGFNKIKQIYQRTGYFCSSFSDFLNGKMKSHGPSFKIFIEFLFLAPPLLLSPTLSISLETYSYKARVAAAHGSIHTHIKIFEHIKK